MKKRYFFVILVLFQTFSLFADMLGNKPSIDFVVSPEIFLFVREMEDATENGGVVANGTLKTDFKFVNFLWWDEGVFGNRNTKKLYSENIFGIYLKNPIPQVFFLMTVTNILI